MTINFTIAIQIINFIIAYFIISKIFLKPAISIIQQDSELEKNLLNSITIKEQKVAEKENHKQNLFLNSLDLFKKEKPILEQKKSKFIWKTPVSSEFSNESKIQLTNNITDKIINKVKHVKQ